MIIGIYSPYLDTAGGGEKYMLSIAEYLSKNRRVDVFLDRHLQELDINKIKSLNEKRHNLDLSNVKFIKAPFGEGSIQIQRLVFLKKYDLVIYLTDGSIFYSSAKRSILHIQSPIINKKLLQPLNKIKLSSWDMIIYNSEFTKINCQKYWGKEAKVIYPPVNTDQIKPLKKQKIILTVGRFFGYLKPKRQEEMIQVFKKMVDEGAVEGWSFHLAGGIEGGEEYFKNLEGVAKGYPIVFHPDVSFKDLNKLYGESSIYWHAAGFGETDPTKMEHFGITTAEAMAGGCVPVVINKGGQPEIVEGTKSGFLWDSLEELKEQTIKLIGDESLREKMGKSAKLRSRIFNKERFEKEIEKVVNG